MTAIIVVPNGIWKKLGDIWKLLESGELSQLPDEANKGEFKAEPISEEELADLAKEVKERLKRQGGDGSRLILGSADFLPFDFFKKGSNAGESVCCLLRSFNDRELDEIVELAKQDARIRAEAIKWLVDSGSSIDPAKEADKEEFKRQARQKQVPCGTGFLVGDRYLLTNLHVLEDKDRLSDFYAAFDYVGDLKNAKHYSFDPQFWKPAGNPNLDYVLLKLQPPDRQEDEEPLKPISLIAVDSVRVIPELSVKRLESLYQAGKLLEEERNQLQNRLEENNFPYDLVNIIQHPDGRSKEIVIFNNHLKDLDPNFLVYTSDAQPGSSGSPLFNTRWELIGLHQAALMEQKENSDPKVTGYLGIRMSSILADLRKQAMGGDPQIQEFLKAVGLVEPTPTPTPSPSPTPRPTKRQVLILAGRDRSSILPKNLASLEQRSMLQLQQQVQQALRQLDSSIEVRPINGSGKNLKAAIQEINQQAAESSDTQSVAIELLTDDYSDPKVRGISTYYYGGNPRRKDEANALLDRIREKGIPVFGLGAYSDRVTSSGRLDFCRQTTMPALVFYAGYLSHEGDRARIEALQTEISPLAEGIAAGLLAWLQRIN
jgi:N-acetylmuramoyl-L-alanine amidase